jgi:hypothetical protein
MHMKRLFLLPGLLAALLLPTLIYALQSTPQFLCSTPSGYGVEVNPQHYILDLQCQPMLNNTLDIPPGQSARFTVNLGNFYAASGRNNAAFKIHFAMDRAWIMVRQADSLQGTTLRDTLSALQDVLINTAAPSYTFVVENRGLRSAVLDVSLRSVD